MKKKRGRRSVLGFYFSFYIFSLFVILIFFSFVIRHIFIISIYFYIYHFSLFLYLVKVNAKIKKFKKDDLKKIPISIFAPFNSSIYQSYKFTLEFSKITN